MSLQYKNITIYKTLVVHKVYTSYNYTKMYMYKPCNKWSQCQIFNIQYDTHWHVYAPKWMTKYFKGQWATKRTVTWDNNEKN
jgi:hypothetical protein